MVKEHDTMTMQDIASALNDQEAIRGALIIATGLGVAFVVLAVIF